MSSAAAMGSLWSYAEADATVLAVVVVLVAAAAALFVGRRAFGRHRRSRG
jgi:ABC-type uncharacterized transport system permease subunit